MVYFLSEEHTEHRNDQADVVHKAGVQWIEGADVTYWSENRGIETARLVNVDGLANSVFHLIEATRSAGHHLLGFEAKQNG